MMLPFIALAVAVPEEKGQPVVYVKAKRMAASRLEGLSLEVA